MIMNLMSRGGDEGKKAADVMVYPEICEMKHKVWKRNVRTCKYVSVQFSHSGISDSLRAHGL